MTDAELNAFPCKCDHCRWTGTIGEAWVFDNKIHCPKCGGPLSSNRVADQLTGMVQELTETNPDGW